jgi:hypothetical protein
MHLYGSSRDGPYYISNIENPTPPKLVRGTDYRIRNGLNEFINKFGVPDKIVLETINWDNMAVGEKKMELHEYKINTMRAVQLIRSIVGTTNGTEIALRTSPIGKYPGFFYQLNTLAREVAVENQITIFDWSNDLWSVLQYDITQDNSEILLRDVSHPKIYYSRLAALKQLGSLYSRFHFENGTIPSRDYTIDSLTPKYTGVRIYLMQTLRTSTPYQDHSTGNTMSNVTGNSKINNKMGLEILEKPKEYLWFQDEERDLYYIHETEDGQRYRIGNITNRDIRVLGLGIGDIMTVTQNIIQSIPIWTNAPIIPPMFTDKLVGVLTKSGKTYVMFRNHFIARAADQKTVLKHLYSSLEDVFVDVDDFWFTHIPEFYDIAKDFYAENSLLRYHKDRTVYVVRNGLRCAIQNVQVMFRNGWDFSEVKVLLHEELLTILKTGPAMS